MADKKFSGRTLPLLPLRELLVFPHTVIPLFVGREKSIKALDTAMARNREIFLAAQKKPKSNDPTPDEIYEFGTIAQILQLLRLPDGTVKILLEGKKRAKINCYHESEDMLLVEVTELNDAVKSNTENEALIRTVKQAFDTYVKLNKKLSPEVVFSISNIDDESKLADTLAVQLSNLKLVDKQKVLEILDPAKRLEEIFGIIQSEIEILRVEKKIRARVKRQMEKTQKEYYLNEQMTAIQKELGNTDDLRTEIAEIETKLKSKTLSEEASTKLKKEIRKLKGMTPMSAEASVVRGYIDTVLSLPWGEYSKTLKDIVYAEKILNEDHYGLEKIKERILEYLAVTNLSDSIKGSILCLVGPPGVGKTSLAHSIARAIGREFVRISLGGVRDEAEIRGHRRTYVGAMPGKIITSLKKSGTGNPVILLDEIDKMSSDFRGDPSSAMLEVLDPEQNNVFNDHYLDLDYDLSKILFVATANSITNIPKPLLDRMELIQLGGYTEEEKFNIAQKHLLAKVSKANGFDPHTLALEPSALEGLIRYYTREAGVRNLEREISNICRKIARESLKDQPHVHVITPPHITNELLKKYLGQYKFNINEKEIQNEVGICQGLAYTEVGGELLVTEVALMSGKGNLKITGKLGDVMQESAQAAFSYVRSRSTFLNLAEDFHSNIDIHVHFPEGAIPKDGPSAGITIATALVSALTKHPFNREIAMTGEITLRGRVLPIGGLKEKLLAAHRAGIKKVIIPKENERDLIDIPQTVRNNLEIVLVDHIDHVLLHALQWDAQDVLKDKIQSSLQTILPQVTEMNELIVPCPLN